MRAKAGFGDCSSSSLRGAGTSVGSDAPSAALKEDVCCERCSAPWPPSVWWVFLLPPPDVLSACPGVFGWLVFNCSPWIILWTCTGKEEGTHSVRLICDLQNTDWLLGFTERQMQSKFHWFLKRDYNLICQAFLLWITCLCPHGHWRILHVSTHIITCLWFILMFLLLQIKW